MGGVTTLHLGQTQVTNCRAGIWVDACHSHGLCVCKGMYPGYNCSKIEQEVQNKTNAGEKPAAQEYRLDERIYLMGRASELSTKAPAPGPERHHKQVMDGGWVSSRLLCFHITSRLQGEQDRTQTSLQWSPGTWPIPAETEILLFICNQ